RPRRISAAGGAARQAPAAQLTGHTVRKKRAADFCRPFLFWGIARLGGFAEPLVERIARATYRSDRIRGAATIERAPQPPDMHIDGALIDIDIASPHAVEQLLARVDAARALHQEFEQAEFGRPEMHLAA